MDIYSFITIQLIRKKLTNINVDESGIDIGESRKIS